MLINSTDKLLILVGEMKTRATNNPDGVKASTLEMFADDLEKLVKEMTTEKVYVVISSYFDFCNEFTSIHEIYKNRTDADNAVKDLESKLPKDEKQQTYWVEEWILE